MSRKVQLEQAYKAAVEEINNFCKSGSYPTPNLVAVSKYKPVEDIQVLYQLGQRHFGENYVQELQSKAQQLPQDIQWHFIGNLQSNKAKIAREIPNLAFVETVDSESKATKLNTQRGQVGVGALLGVYIQVNTSEEPQKAGILAEDFDKILALASHITSNCDHLNMCGLMTIGSFEQSHGENSENKDFAKLVRVRNQLAEKLGTSPEKIGLSMGMSADFLQAIKQGSTNVRVGSSIFGGRLTKEEIKTGAAEESK